MYPEEGNIRKYTVEDVTDRKPERVVRLLNAYAEEVTRLKAYEESFEVLESALKNRELYLITAMFSEDGSFIQFVAFGKRNCFCTSLSYPIEDIIYERKKAEEDD